MNRDDEARYGRMCLLVLNVCSFTLRRVIDDYALLHAGSLSLCDFLEKNKDRLFHLYKRECCCGHRSNITPMYQSQWDSLYNRNTSTCLNGKRIDCPCKYDGKKSATTNVMNVTLCCLVINNICPGVDANHIKTIREIRDKLIHAESARLDLKTFNVDSNRIKTAICQLAKKVSTTLHTDTVEMIVELENRLIDPVELSVLRNLIIDVKRFTDLEADTSSIAENLVQTREEMFEIQEKLMRTVHEHNQRQDDISRLAAAFADQEQTIAKQQEKLDSLQLEKSESSKESPAWTEDNLANLVHEIESSLKTGHITDELRSLLNNTQEMMSLPSGEKRKVREKLEGIVTNHFKQNLSSEQFSVTLAVRDNSFHFVVICEDRAFQTKAYQNWITFIMTNDVKMESIDVIPQRMRNPHSDIDKKKLEEFISTECHSSHGNTLFDDHSNLNSISFTKGKSINYGSRDWTITDEICIVLQCFHKGYIPFGESPFPSKIGNYRTDVREGHCSLSAGPKVQMGKSVYTESIQLKSCLGNFVQFEDGSNAFITCAHVIFPVQNLRNISSLYNYRGTEVYDTETRQKIGQVRDLQFVCDMDESVDAALVLLDRNTEIEPGFPTINMDQIQHAGFLLQPLCISSTVLKIDNSNMKCYVVKYGPETHLTVGSLELGIISCKPFHWDIKENIPTSSLDNEPLIMRNQILIRFPPAGRLRIIRVYG